MPVTRAGEKISWREFGKRWKEGIAGITPLQQMKMQIKSTWIILLGLIFGIVICVINIKNLWWLLVILTGGFFNTLVTMIGLYQKYWIQKRLRETEQEFEDFFSQKDLNSSGEYIEND